MAKTNEQFDQHFREKLADHREKPSSLAWERLNDQLPKSSKPSFGIWWAVAASVTTLLIAGHSFWPDEESISAENLVAQQTEIPLDGQEEPSAESSSEVREITAIESKPETVTTDTQSGNKQKTGKKTTPAPSSVSSPATQNLIAQTEPKSAEPAISVQVPELKTEEPSVILPELKAPDLERTIAQNTAKAEEEPLYRVNIYSNGVKKGEAPDKNLINELGKTVGQVEGFLGKVDEGLIGLQDKKDNLFTSLVSKINQAEERR